MLTATRLEIFSYINKCIHVSKDPDALEILKEVLQSVTNFENKLMTDLDVD